MLTKQEFTAVAETYLDMVYRVALNCLKNPADAEDAAQETMLRLWRSDTEFESEEHLRCWLVRVCINICRDSARSLWRRTVSAESCAEPVFEDSTQKEIWCEVMSLHPKYRLPLYLYYYEGYTVAEIGKIMGLKISTVQTRLARARTRLKTRLEEE